MNVEAAFSRLPDTHAAALRLRARGFDDDAIAAALALEPAAVAPLLQIAEAKLAALTARGGGSIVPVRISHE
jgi:DNA-directed RNA polymerase specialized sigma24 family protein